MEIGRYYSIQNDFPKNYRLDYKGTSDVVPPELMEKIGHLKAYLFFFERLLLDHAHRLSSISTTLSVYQTINPGESELERLTKEIPDFDARNITVDKLDGAESVEDSLKALEEKHQVVEHLLARFATIYKAIDDPSQQTELLQTLDAKISLLKDIPVINSQRGLGVPLSPNYSNVWDQNLLSGFEKRMIRLLGLRNQNFILQKLTEIPGAQPAGFYCIEHILLAQRWDEGLFPKKYNRAAELLHDYLIELSAGRLSNDTYSFQLSIIIPDWYRSWNGRRQLVESAIKEEVPAHILPHFHWLDKKSMSELEILFADWLEAILHLYSQ
jgi:hypothetical protein